MRARHLFDKEIVSSQSRFVDINRNKDGKIGYNEAQMFAGEVNISQQFVITDINGDGFIAPFELDSSMC